MLQKLADHPLSKREEKFISQFMVPFEPPIKLSEIAQVSLAKKIFFLKGLNITKLEISKKSKLEREIDSNGKEGRLYSEFTAKQRTAKVSLKLFEGTGKILIKAPEGEFDILFFESLTHRYKHLKD
jgi:hypothetical protein